MPSSLEQSRLDCRRLAFYSETDSGYAFSRRKIASRGRGFTDRESFSVPFGHGCTWLSAGGYNPLLKLAMEEGHRMEARFFPTANTKTFLEDRWATEDEESEKDRFMAECERALREAADSGSDVAWTDLIDAKSPWMSYLNGRNERDGATTSACSTLDVARNQGSGELRFVHDGYRTLIETLFAGEATSKAQYGFAHGAYLEGKAAAERVIAMLELMSSP